MTTRNHSTREKLFLETTALNALLILLVSVSPRPVSAQGDLLVQAEMAYATVDFEKTLSLAEKALNSGRLESTELVRAYKLIGISATALDQRDRGRDAFVRMLAFDADARVENDLSPTLRGPFMEARGFWASQPERLNVSVDLVKQRGALRVELSDPLDMVDSVIINTRMEGSEQFEGTTEDAVETQYITVDGADEGGRVEYTLTLLDEYGNRIFEIGDDEVPEVVGEAVVQERSVARKAWFWVVMGVTAAAIAGGVTAGVVLWDNSETPSVATNVSTVF